MRQLQRTLNDHSVEGGTFRVIAWHKTNLISFIDYSWKALASPIVDVGGGIGTLELEILRQPEMEQHEFIIFDLPNTVENAEKVCRNLYNFIRRLTCRV